ncbi:GntR family transcriptional regulator [Actinomadura sp. DC4]|uniref:GntR family transcriptional regulator n=1 Tax=Actinomadura sp. DC4 TaxID=3055069 RepID=UPI0025AF1B9A|nr:GntR family transcriptional regulator [Actinomadura sp. DC4]MDN3360042.1 GntR family transcriptional regulator [Actinomadura sp. DC4]
MESDLTGLSGARTLLDRTSTVSRLAGALRTRIIEGALRPGAQLPEHAVADLLGVSRNTLREAFRLLAHEGLVVHEPHRGVFVRTLDAADVRDIYTTRRLVECAAVRSENAPPEAVAELRAAVGAAQAAVAGERWNDVGTADLRFHAAIVALAGSWRLDGLMDRVLAELRLAFHVLDDPRRLHEPYVRRNGEIAALVEQGRTADAADALAAYLDDAERELLAGIR